MIVLVGFSFSCFNDNDDDIASDTSIKNFVWNSMNATYLYKSEINNLSNDRFGTNNEYLEFIDSFEDPESLFEALIYDRQIVDRFSLISNNYYQLEQQLSGLSRINGAEYNFYLVPGSSSEVFGIVRLILPNTNASNTNLLRGSIFNKINGVQITTNNLSSLLNNDSYSLNMAIYNDNDTDTASDDEIIDSNEIISLTKEEYNENPIYSHSVINVGPEKAGYLMYNGFINEYNEELNQVFGEFKSQNIDHLILDLRYNSGGSIQTATLLGSMITGQFNNQIFTTLKYNDELQSNNVNYNFTNNFNNDLIINNLNLNKVYIITSNRSASASEMMINSLKCYIDVIQIGDETVGKSQASTILYDSPNLSRNNVNSSHTYAILPLIAITVNKNDEEVPSSGIVPEISIIENPKEYGIIGDSFEPILELVLAEIQGFNRIPISSNNSYNLIYEDDTNSIKNLMYVKSASNK